MPFSFPVYQSNFAERLPLLCRYTSEMKEFKYDVTLMLRRTQKLKKLYKYESKRDVLVNLSLYIDILRLYGNPAQ